MKRSMTPTEKLMRATYEMGYRDCERKRDRDPDRIFAEGQVGNRTTQAAAPEPAATPVDPVVVGGVYRHYKGDLYIVVGVALESTNGRPRERVVVYLACGKTLNVRTEREFQERVVNGESRFTLVAQPPADVEPHLRTEGDES